jgi:hypothetical protein
MKKKAGKPSLKVQKTVYFDDLSTKYINDLVTEKNYQSPS